MNKRERFRKKMLDYKYDHAQLIAVLDTTKSAIYSILAAALYAFSFYCFITPAVVDHITTNGSSIITGGVGGISQVITLIIELCGGQPDPYTMQSILYFALNVPILIFAFFKVGKRFAIITLINVALSSLFIQVFARFEPISSITSKVAEAINSEHLARVLFAGVCVGCGSALAYKGDTSCGGVDVFSYYFALRKSTSVGKYSAILNSFIIITYTILTIIYNQGNQMNVALLNFLYSIVYLFVVMLVVDFINTRNKKVQLQIITSVDSMSSILIANFPHSTTIVDAKGGYTHQEKQVIYMVISSNEVKKVVALVKRVDYHSFVTVTALVQAYGNFFVKPVE
ncbi:MAG: YitT family protein [Bacilli bacterium]|nr:YitT family protein [Bacilli bacterium]